jgi:rhodanese-related sulfurtransferase
MRHWCARRRPGTLLGMTSLVTRAPAASPAEATEYFERRLAFETDATDVARDLRIGAAAFTIVDVRSSEQYAAGHLPGAVSLPGGLGADLPDHEVLVVYCWGPGCNGAHRAAARLSAQGYRVKEMLGGFEYWVREGHPVEGSETEALGQRADHLLVG